MTFPHQIAIVIVNWNTGKLLRECLQSITALPEQDRIARVFVVDNASSDNSLELAKATISSNKKFHFHRLNSNHGFAAANNLVLKDISPHTHVLLLNPDTRVVPHTLTALLQIFEHNPRAGIVGPKLLHADGTIQPSVRRFPTLIIFLTWFLKLTKLLKHSTPWRRYLQSDFDYTEQQSVSQVMGATLLIRDQVVATIGQLDESFWVWFEEVDYCQRAKNAGWDVIYTPKAKVIHHGGVSFNQLLGPRRVIPFLNSSLHYTRKHLGLPAYFLLLCLYPLAALLSLPTTIIHRFNQRYG